MAITKSEALFKEAVQYIRVALILRSVRSDRSDPHRVLSKKQIKR